MVFPTIRQFFAALLIATAPAVLAAQTVAQAEARARAGDVKAMLALGKSYQDEQAYADARRWYRTAADKGSAEGMRLLGLLYYNSQGVSQDYVAAVKLFRAAAAKGNAVAMWNLGMMHMSGRGTPQSDGDAFKWFRQSVVKGNKGAFYMLALMNHEGRGTPRNFGEALRLFRLAADYGSPGALDIMASMYVHGRGVTVDQAEAQRLEAAANSADPKKWRTFVLPLKPASIVPGRAAPRPANVDADFVADYRKSARNGSEGAMWALATHHEVGMGGFRKDINEAARWYRMLSDRGDQRARQWLIDHGYPY